MTPGIVQIIDPDASLCAAPIPQLHGTEDITRTKNIKRSVLGEVDRVRYDRLLRH
jgi:hypothetical protein